MQSCMQDNQYLIDQKSKQEIELIELRSKLQSLQS